MQKMQLSTNGAIEIVCNEAIITSPYYDSKKIATVGIGHTVHAGLPDPAKMWGKVYTIEAIFDMFYHDVQKYVDDVNKALKVSVTQYQFDALVDFHYNTGAIFKAELTKYINAGDFKRAAAAFLNYSKPPEIIERRKRSMKTFSDGFYGQRFALVMGVTKARNPSWSTAKQVDVRKIIEVYKKTNTVNIIPVTSELYLAKNSRGKAVIEWQTNLINAGYKISAATAYFGNETDAATKAFQTKMGLMPDGRVGAMTLAAMENLLHPKTVEIPTTMTPVATPEPVAPPVVLPTLPSETVKAGGTVVTLDGNGGITVTGDMTIEAGKIDLDDVIPKKTVPVVPPRVVPEEKEHWFVSLLSIFFGKK